MEEIKIDIKTWQDTLCSWIYKLNKERKKNLPKLVLSFGETLVKILM